MLTVNARVILRPRTLHIKLFLTCSGIVQHGAQFAEARRWIGLGCSALSTMEALRKVRSIVETEQKNSSVYI